MPFTFIRVALCCALALAAAPTAKAQVNINIGQSAYAPRVVVVDRAPRGYHYAPKKGKKLKKGYAPVLYPHGHYYYQGRGKGKKGHGKH